MRKVLVPFDGARYEAVDKVALARTAARLLALLPVSDASDSYCLEQRLRPLLMRAIKCELNVPLRERRETISERFFCELNDGTLSTVFSPAFHAAFQRFLVRVLSMPVQEPEVRIINGRKWAFMEMEEPGDWPDKVKYP